MTATQLNIMNTELWQSIGAIADNESLMKRLTKYAKRLVKDKNDPTLLTKEDYLAKLERAEKQIEQGEYTAFESAEALDQYIRNL